MGMIALFIFLCAAADQAQDMPEPKMRTVVVSE